MYQFPTRSRYQGLYNTAVHRMEGFGHYIFPDGSSYRGYFSHGQFHGYGRLQLATPYNFIFKGFFQNGILKRVDEMIFSDGLTVAVPFKGLHLETSKWRYCKPPDRRFTREILFGVSAVNTDPATNDESEERYLPNDTYDTKEGIFRPGNGFITNIPRPFREGRFIACDDEINWIRDNCRCNRKRSESCKPEVCRHILDMNLNVMTKLGQNTQRCACRYVKSFNVRCKQLIKIQGKLERKEKKLLMEEYLYGENATDNMPQYTDEEREEVLKMLADTTKTDSHTSTTLPFSNSMPSADTLSCMESILEAAVSTCHIEVSTLAIPKEHFIDRPTYWRRSTDFSDLWEQEQK